MKLIIFDAYGTLISTGTGSLDAVKKIYELFVNIVFAAYISKGLGMSGEGLVLCTNFRIHS